MLKTKNKNTKIQIWQADSNQIERKRERNFKTLWFANLPEAWTAVNWNVLVSFFETIVFAYVVQKVTTNNNCSGHFCFNNNTSQDSASDWYVTGEWAFFINVCALTSLFKYAKKKLDLKRTRKLKQKEEINVKNLLLLVF